MHGFDGMTHEAKPGRRTVVPVEATSCRGGQGNPVPEVSRDSEWSYGEAKRVQPRCQERVPKVSPYMTVPQTDTGRWDEKSKALEITRVKELGKMHT